MAYASYQQTVAQMKEHFENDSLLNDDELSLTQNPGEQSLPAEQRKRLFPIAIITLPSTEREVILSDSIFVDNNRGHNISEIETDAVATELDRALNSKKLTNYQIEYR